MKRKIIKQGHNTLTVTLPSNWVKNLNIQPGQEIDMIEKENGLFLTTQKNNYLKRAEFDITDLDIPTIWKYFMAVYREGYDEVLIKFKPGTSLKNPYKFLTMHRLDPKYQKEDERTVLSGIQRFVDRFIGYEVIEHGKDFVLVKDMAELTNREFDSSLRRVFLLIQQMCEETLEAIKTGNLEGLIHIHDVDINLDKFHDYCIRVLNKTSNRESRKNSLYFSTLYLLELLGDEFKNISTHLIHDFPKTNFKNIKKPVELVKDQFDNLYLLFYKFNKETVKKIAEIDKEIYFSVPEIYKKANEHEKEIFHHLRIISRFINALMELRIEMEY